MKKLLSAIRNRVYSSRVVQKFLFERRYSKPDPYQAKSDYEMQKFIHGFSLLEGNFKRGLEIGCGEGVNTWRMAHRCERVLAVDLSSKAIKRAQFANDKLNVIFRVFDITVEDFITKFDYVFCADTLYYLTRA
jgi:2-polyprenyl-3-methyl-5-hydroxy-6-metoxy-1,4-benzoquinol methylase